MCFASHHNQPFLQEPDFFFLSGKQHLEASIFFFKINYLFLFLAVLGLRCCAWAFSSCGEQGLLFVAVRGLLIAVASLVAEHGLQVPGLQQLWHMGSVVVAHGLSCSVACGGLPGPGLKPMSLHWQVDSYPLCHQGSPGGLNLSSKGTYCYWVSHCFQAFFSGQSYICRINSQKQNRFKEAMCTFLVLIIKLFKRTEK